MMIGDGKRLSGSRTNVFHRNLDQDLLATADYPCCVWESRAKKALRTLSTRRQDCESIDEAYITPMIWLHRVQLEESHVLVAYCNTRSLVWRVLVVGRSCTWLTAGYDMGSMADGRGSAEQWARRLCDHMQKCSVGYAIMQQSKSEDLKSLVICSQSEYEISSRLTRALQ